MHLLSVEAVSKDYGLRPVLDNMSLGLDSQTLMVLEEYLDGFPGNLIVVSHDRYFLDRTVEHVIRFEGGGRLREYPGNNSAFLEAHREEGARPPPPSPPTPCARRGGRTLRRRPPGASSVAPGQAA